MPGQSCFMFAYFFILALLKANICDGHVTFSMIISHADADSPNHWSLTNRYNVCLQGWWKIQDFWVPVRHVKSIDVSRRKSKRLDRPSQYWSHRAACCSPNWRTSGYILMNIVERKLTFWELKEKKIKLFGCYWHFCEFTYWTQLGSHGEDQREMFLCFHQAGEETDQFEIYQNILFSLTRPAFRRNYFTRT